MTNTIHYNLFDGVETHYFIMSQDNETPFLFNLTRWSHTHHIRVEGLIKRMTKKGIKTLKRPVAKTEGSQNWFVSPEEYITILILEATSPVLVLQRIYSTYKDFSTTALRELVMKQTSPLIPDLSVSSQQNSSPIIPPQDTLLNIRAPPVGNSVPPRVKSWKDLMPETKSCTSCNW